MKVSMINLGIAQLYSACNRIRNINFPTDEKNTLRDDLCTLIDNFHNIQTNRLLPNERPYFASHIDTLSVWLTALEKSLCFSVNDETIQLIDRLCRFWIPKYGQRTLLFDDGAFAVNQVPCNTLGNTLLESHLKHQMQKYPIIIYTPYYLKDDILSNLTLFHEVGHVVASEYCLVDYVEKDILKEINSNWGCRLAKNYFPTIKSNSETKKIRNHINEYIADFFAAMYLGNHMITYLEFITRNDRHEDSNTHPSLECRKSLASSVLGNSQVDKFYQIIKSNIEGKCKKGDTTLMRVSLATNNFNTGQHTPLSTESELFSVYNPVWDVLEGSTDLTKREYDWARALSKHDFYDMLNTALKSSVRTI